MNTAADTSASRRSVAITILLFACLVGTGIFLSATLRLGQGWDDDYAQYLAHARNLATGRPYAQTGYIYNHYDPAHGPAMYPPGLPVLLTPLIREFGLSLQPCKYVSVLAVVACMALMYLMSVRWGLSPAAALFTSLFLGLNPWTLAMKERILSDIPFLALVMAVLLWQKRVYQRRSFGWASVIITAALLSAANSMRSVGIALFGAVLAYDLWVHHKPSAYVIKALALAMLVGFVVRRLTGGGESSYLDSLRLCTVWTPIHNLSHLPGGLGYYLFGRLPMVPFSKEAAFLLTSIFALIGCIGAFRRGPGIAEFFFLAYLAIVAVWPIGDTRFLLPLMPLYLLYACIGAQIAVSLLKAERLRRGLCIAAAGVLLLLCVPGIQAAWQNRGTPMPDGIHTAAARELFSFVRANTEPSATFLFRKPRAFALMTDRRASVPPYGQPDKALWAYLDEIKATHLILDRQDSADTTYLQPFVERHPARFQKVFESARFTASAIQQADPSTQPESSSTVPAER